MAYDGLRPRLQTAWSKTRAWTAKAGARFVRAPWKSIGLWAGGVFGILVATLILFLTFADWNALRGPIARFASAATGRPIAIRGDLDVHPWSWTPRVSVGGLYIGNQARFRDRGAFANIGQADVSFRWLPLLVGQFDIVKLDMRNANLALYRTADGDSTWSSAPGAARGKPFNLPAIREFSLDDGALDYVDEARHLQLNAHFSTRESANQSDPGRFELNGEGRFNRQPFDLTFAGAPLLNVRRDRPYAFTADVRAGATHIKANGAIARPFDLNRISADVEGSGSDLADLYYLLGLALPNTPPYNLHGRFVREGERYSMRDISGRVGDSDLSGEFTASHHERSRLMLEGAFTSRSLDFDDLMAVFGGAPNARETASPEQRAAARELAAQGRLLPDARLDISRVRNMDARVTYRAAHVRSEHVPLRGMSVDVNLDHGLLQLDPFTLELAQGRVGGAVALNARTDVPHVNMDVRLSNARLENFIRLGEGGQPITGALTGRARLAGAGASVRQVAANADGAVTLVVPSGEVREALAELTGVNVTRGLGLLLSNDQDTIGIRCGVASFDVRNGIATARTMVIDTRTMLIQGEGTISLRDERMNLRLQGAPKEVRLVRIAAPIRIQGHLRDPSLGVDAGPLAGQTGVAAILASIVAPLAAVLPFVDPGLADDANCQQLLATGRAPAPAARAG